MELRPYQTQAIADVRRSLAEGNRRVVLQLATGAGKTRIAAEIIQRAFVKGTRTLFLAPRRELIYQARDAFERQGVRSGTIMAGERPDYALPLQVASFDTLHARAVRGKRMGMPEAGLVIVDEAHLSISETRAEILALYPDARIIGLTATPARGDGRGLGEIYDALVQGPSLRELTDMGFLVPVRYYAPDKPDLAAVKINRDGDYAETALGGVMNSPVLVGNIVEHWQKLASMRRTVVFCVNCAHSRAVCSAFVTAGVSAEHLDGETPPQERADILERVRRGATQVLCNVFVATYGLDIPALDCAVLARPTKNIALYLQTVGRILRPYTGKADALVIDHAGAVAENGFVDEYIPWSLDTQTKVKDRKEAAQKDRKEPKEIECPHCSTVFKLRRNCPSCGLAVIPPEKDLPIHEATLIELDREAAKANREMSWEEKAEFMGQLKTYARNHGYSPGWIAHKYREKTGVWPNDPRAKMAPMRELTAEVKSWITSRNIRYAKRKTA